MVAAKSWLVFASLLFYSWWNLTYLPLILSSLLFNYTVGNILSGKTAKTKQKNRIRQKNRINKKSILTVGIVANISLLGYFKYSDFALENINLLFGSSIPLLHLALPLAISFFTFQQIAYLVDSYRGETREYDFLNYALFVTFFPQLIAGPIVHHSEMMPQFASRWNLVVRYKHILTGIFIFSIGLFKKVVIADTFALWATQGFDLATTLSMAEAWKSSLSYTFQIYYDFSGYTDMAIGSALLFNIKLPINFNSPYKALNIQDFWRRWHITLSRFLKEYIYIPLGGNRAGELRTNLNLLGTFIIGGIWHGAGWTFLFWGLLHGSALVVHRVWHRYGWSMWAPLAWLLTFLFVNFTWVFFRAKEWADAIKVLSAMVGIEQMRAISDYQQIPIHHTLSKEKIYSWILLATIATLLSKNSTQFVAYPKLDREDIYTTRYIILFSLIFVYAVVMMSLSSYTEFIYFNF